MLLLLTAVLVTPQLDAQERILSYDSKVQINRDGSLDVTEAITVRAEGQSIRRGIYRDFPTKYRDRFGNRVNVALDVTGVERDGRPEPWFTERMANGIRINTGSDDFLPVPATYTYRLRYRTTRQLGFFDSHDELYWNAIGTGWVFPIESGSVEVRVPAAVPARRMTAEAYTGPQGARGTAYTAELPGLGAARYRLTKPLEPYEGFTIVLAFPKGVVTEPGNAERAQWFLSDNKGVLVALTGLVVLLFYTIREWRRVGRDPAKGIIIAQYEPPEGHTPAGLRYLRRMGYDMRCFTADVVALAVAGYLRIHQEDKLLRDEWRLDRDTPAFRQPLSASQKTLLSGLFPGGKPTLVLARKNAGVLGTARQAHAKGLDDEFQPRYFRRNGKKVGVAILIQTVATIAAFVLSRGYGISAIIGVVLLMIATLVVFAVLIRAPTPEGRALLDESEGLKLYMEVAERDELAAMRGPGEPHLDAQRYERLLPFAVALDVEEAWTRKFSEAAGAAAAAQAASGMSWYSGRGSFSNIGDFSSAIGSGLSSQISSSASPPGGSSGSGGGGSSGGGGGGGGGGGR